MSANNRHPGLVALSWLLVFLGLCIAFIAAAAPHLGLGVNREFIVYRWTGVPRANLLRIGFYFMIFGGIAYLAAIARVRETTCHRLRLFVTSKHWHRLFILPPQRFLALSTGKMLALLSINILVLGIGLTVIEIFVRMFVPEASIYRQAQPGQYFRFQPYMQSSNEGPLDHRGIWRDPLHNVDIPFHVKSNSLGFRIDHELDTTTRREKADNERVVLIFGGSAVYGFGNSSNDTTVAGWLQRLLNERQSGIRYTVFNMGNGGWVSYQQFIALNLYGMNLQPDWIIFMDGRNDIFTIPALAGDDVGLHFSTGTMRNYIDGYLYRQPSPDFLRSNWENYLIGASAAYRLLTGKRPIENQSTRFPKVRDWSHVEKTVDFYLRTQQSVLKQCQNCNYILSTQPIYRSGRKRLGDEEIRTYQQKYRDVKIDVNFLARPEFEDILMYAYSRMINEMPAVCREHPRCSYHVMDDAFPKLDSEKHVHFVDDVHMTDSGNRLAAELYAREILTKTTATR
jgi:hypothetical protein